MIDSCTKDTVDTPDIGRKITINGLITNDAPINLSISRSAYLLDLHDIDFLMQDSIKALIIENGRKIDSLEPEKYFESSFFDVFSKGNYKSTSFINPSSGKQYRIDVSGKNLPNASASFSIPDVVNIEKIDTSRIVLTPGSYSTNNNGFLCKIEFNDPVGRENYYMMRIFLNTYYAPYENSNIPFKHEYLIFSSSDPVIEEKLNNINGIQAIAFSDKLINGQKHSMEIIIRGELIGEPLIKSNDSFSSYLTIQKKTLYFKLFSINEEFFRYIQTLQLYSRNYNNPLEEPVLMKSNITGGYGMITGAAVSNDSIVFNLQ
jgi:hypothetical protein